MTSAVIRFDRPQADTVGYTMAAALIGLLGERARLWFRDRRSRKKQESDDRAEVQIRVIDEGQEMRQQLHADLRAANASVMDLMTRLHAMEIRAVLAEEAVKQKERTILRLETHQQDVAKLREKADPAVNP